MMAGFQPGSLVWNARQQRVPAFWRVVIVLVVIIAASLALEPVLVRLPWLAQATVGNLLLQILLPLAVVYAGARWLDRRSLTGYGLRLDRRWWYDFGFGALLGFVMYAMAFAVIVGAGWGEVTAVLAPGPQGGFWLMFGLAGFRWLGNAFWEELLMRGVFVKNAAEGFAGRLSATAAVVAALMLSTVVFALIHIPDYQHVDVPMAGLVSMWMLLGGLLGLGYVVTGRLGLPMGLHLTVNLALNNVFGLTSVLGESATLVRTEIVGPAAMADLGGAVHIGVILLGYLVLVLWARRRPGGLRLATELARPPGKVAATTG